MHASGARQPAARGSDFLQAPSSEGEFRTMHALALPTLSAIQTTVDGGLTLGEVVDSLPSDPASLFVLLVLTASVILVVWTGGGRKGGGGAAT